MTGLTYVLRVTQDMIDNPGTGAQSCPVYQAAKAAGIDVQAAGRRVIQALDTDGSEIHAYLPKDAIDWIKRLDHQETMEPISFPLEFQNPIFRP